MLHIPMTKEELQTIIQELGISNSELAKRICIGRENVGRWLKGTRRISVQNAKLIRQLVEQERNRKMEM